MQANGKASFSSLSSTKFGGDRADCGRETSPLDSRSELRLCVCIYKDARHSTPQVALRGRMRSCSDTSEAFSKRSEILSLGFSDKSPPIASSPSARRLKLAQTRILRGFQLVDSKIKRWTKSFTTPPHRRQSLTPRRSRERWPNQTRFSNVSSTKPNLQEKHPSSSNRTL